MEDNASTLCPQCQATMAPIVLMDRYHPNSRFSQELEYRLPGDKPSFWTGKYPSGGKVQAFMCGDCGRIVLYGRVPDGS